MTDRLRAAALAALAFAFGWWVALGAPHPADLCHEDEVWWWVADDTRDCVPLDGWWTPNNERIGQ